MSNITPLLLNTEPINKVQAAQAVRELYKIGKRPSPTLHFINGPQHFLDVFEEAKWCDLYTDNDIAHFTNKRFIDQISRLTNVISKVFGNLVKPENRWLNSVFMPKYYMYEEKYKWEQVASKVWDECYLLLTAENICFIFDRPKLIHHNHRGFHNVNGPSIVFRDGSEVYCYEGLKVEKDHLLNPQSMTLKDIHQHNSRKHILIDMVGVDHYLELVKAWKPDAKGKFKKFFFYNMEPRNESEKSYGHLYEKNPYIVEISHRNVNGKYALCMHSNYDDYAFWGDPLKNEHVSDILEPQDYELWNLLDMNETFNRGRGPLKLILSYQNSIFSLNSEKLFENYYSFRHDVAPAWFKAKMLREQFAYYETDTYAIKYENSKLSYEGNVNGHNSLFGGCENLPSYNFDIDLTANSWENLLEQWANLAFNWLGLHEDSTRIP